MQASYKGFRKPYVIFLAAKDDLQNTKSIVETLQNNNIAVDYAYAPGKAEIERSIAVIAMLSKSFYEDEKLTQAILHAANIGIEIIPVYLDDEKVPPVLSMLLYSVHSLRKNRYDSIEKLSERIISSDALKNPQVSKKQKNQFKLIALSAAAIALIAVVVSAITVTAAASKRKEVMVSYGISEEELSTIESAIFVGNRLIRPEDPNQSFGKFMYDIWEDGNNHNIWFFGDTGEEVPMGTISDFSILKKMTNLRRLTIINQPVSQMPDLSGLPQLDILEIFNCNISDLSFLKGCRLWGLSLRCLPATDLSPLSSLNNLHKLEVMGFAGTSINFSSPSLEDYCVCNSKHLRDISSISESKNLTRFYINADEVLVDISSLKDLDKLEEIYIGGGPVKDASSLANKPNVKSITISDNAVMDTDFLKNLGTDSLDYFHFYSWNETPNPVDFSGLASLKRIGSFNFSCNGFDYNIVGRYITDVEIEEYNIGHTKNIDFEMMPKGVKRLGLTGYRSNSLLIPDNLTLEGLNINDSAYLTNLNGIEKIQGLRDINLCECLRLKDFDGLYELSEDLGSVTFQRGYVADLRMIGLSNDCAIKIIDPITEYNDIACVAELKSKSGDRVDSINELVINGVSDVRGLYALSDADLKINELFTDSILLDVANEYAQKVRDNKGFDVNVGFRKESNTEIEAYNFKLVSYEEIPVLPAVALKGVSDIHIMGDLHKDSYCLEWSDELDGDGNPRFIKVEGPIDMQQLAMLENLECLELCNVEVKNFEYIQTFTKLKEVFINQIKAEGTEILDLMMGLNIKEVNEVE